MSDVYMEKKDNGLAVASLVCGIISFCCCNPLYLVSLAAIILGIVGMGKCSDAKGMCIAGIVLGAVSVVLCIIIDIILIPFTFGASFLF